MSQDNPPKNPTQNNDPFDVNFDDEFFKELDEIQNNNRLEVSGNIFDDVLNSPEANAPNPNLTKTTTTPSVTEKVEDLSFLDNLGTDTPPKPNTTSAAQADDLSFLDNLGNEPPSPPSHTEPTAAANVADTAKKDTPSALTKKPAKKSLFSGLFGAGTKKPTTKTKKPTKPETKTAPKEKKAETSSKPKEKKPLFGSLFGGNKKATPKPTDNKTTPAKDSNLPNKKTPAPKGKTAATNKKPNPIVLAAGAGLLALGGAWFFLTQNEEPEMVTPVTPPPAPVVSEPAPATVTESTPPPTEAVATAEPAPSVTPDTSTAIATPPAPDASTNTPPAIDTDAIVNAEIPKDDALIKEEIDRLKDQDSQLSEQKKLMNERLKKLGELTTAKEEQIALIEEQIALLEKEQSSPKK